MKFLHLLLLTACSTTTTKAFSVVSQRQSRSTSVGVTSGRGSRRVVPAIASSKVYQPRRRRQPSVLFEAEETSKEAGEELAKTIDPLVKDTSKLLYRLSWLSWWAQIILTTTSSVTLLFARNVISRSAAAAPATGTLPNFVLAGLGIAVSFGSIFWTWATRRLAGRLVKKRTTRVQAANMLRKDITVGITLNLVGMLFTILGAEQIVGVLAIKVLTTSRALTMAESPSLLQPLDILVVQANTNTLFSHFCSIVALLYLSKSVMKLDPPSTEGDERN
jgi:hypothetical protein